MRRITTLLSVSCAAVAGGRLQAAYLMCLGVDTLAKLAAVSWRKWLCGFIYTEREGPGAYICCVRHISTAGRPLD